MSDDFIDLDFSGVSREAPASIKLLPEGNHVLTITDAKKVPAKEGKEYGQVEVHFECDGATPRVWFSLSPEAKYFIRAFMEAVTGQEIEGPFPLSLNELKGLQVGAVVTVGDSYSKKDKNGVPYKVNNITEYFHASV